MASPLLTPSHGIAAGMTRARNDHARTANLIAGPRLGFYSVFQFSYETRLETNFISGFHLFLYSDSLVPPQFLRFLLGFQQVPIAIAGFQLVSNFMAGSQLDDLQTFATVPQ